MELTALEPRRHRLVQLFLDGEPAVKLDAETAARAGLRPGMELDDETLHELLLESDRARAKEKALWLLESRPHAKRELERKLSRSVGEEAARGAADKMEELGLLDDGDFARRLAAELFRKGWAERRVAQELTLRGVDRELAREAAAEAAPDPAEALRALLERKYARRLGDEKGVRQTAAALQRLGYGWEDIRAALRSVLPDPGEG